MPELPEVETIRFGLQTKIQSQKIASINVILAKMFLGEPQLIIGSTVAGINRHGKLLNISLNTVDQDYHLLIHLKMTGQLVFQGNETLISGGHPIPPLNTHLPNKSTKVIIKFSTGDTLFFNDLRTFGYMKLVTAQKLKEEAFINNIGIEPLTEEFTLAKLNQILSRHPNSNIKSFLLDQKNIAGLGNIYTDESLFHARILPWRIINSLSAKEVERLHTSIRTVLKAGVELQGASQTSYINVDGIKGTFLSQAAVYQRKGLPCPICKNPIQKIKWAGRGTHYCPQCQK